MTPGVAGKLAAECLDLLVPHVVPGVVTDELDRMAREFILDNGALPACLFYRGYGKTLCISPNHVVCHGIPGERTLREGDVANGVTTPALAIIPASPDPEWVTSRCARTASSGFMWMSGHAVL